MISNLNADPQKYIDQAKKLENSKSLFEFIFRDLTSDRYEKIANFYEKAGNIYKITNKEKAIDCFKLANNYLLDIESNEYYENEIKKNLLNIAELYLQIDFIKSVEIYEKIINHFTLKGDISNIIKYYEIIANLYSENLHYDKSQIFYEKTKLLCESHNVCSDVKKRVGEKLAEIYIRQNNPSGYLESAKIYFEIADEFLKTKLGTYSAKKYIFNGLLANLAGGDLVKTNQDFNKYCISDYTFVNSTEGQFIIKLLGLIDSSDFEGLSILCELRDKTNPLDNIQVGLLLQIKKQLTNGLDNFDEPDEPDLS